MFVKQEGEEFFGHATKENWTRHCCCCCLLLCKKKASKLVKKTCRQAAVYFEMAHLHIAGNAEQLHKEFENFVIKLSNSAVSDHGFFSIGFSGGSSAAIVGKALAQNQDLQWDKWNVFFCDERFVGLKGSDQILVSKRFYVLPKQQKGKMGLASIRVVREDTTKGVCPICSI